MCAAAAACTSTPPPLRVGTTYTVQQSGALDLIDSILFTAPLLFFYLRFVLDVS